MEPEAWKDSDAKTCRQKLALYAEEDGLDLRHNAE